MVRKVAWWTLSVASVILSIFFLFMGIQLCLASYRLDHPHQFILTFFASNLIILISIAILAGVLVRIIARLRQGSAPPDEERPLLARDSHDQPNT